MQQLRIAIVGTGGIVQNKHLPAYANIPEAKVVAVCDAAPGRAEQVAAKFGIPRFYTDYLEMVAAGEIDAVQVCTPNFLHAPVALAALKAGKHVLCEKPLALNANQAREMVNTARRVGKTLMVGFNNRFRTDAQVLRRHIDAGDLGDIYYVKCGWLRRRGNPFGWFADSAQSGGGPLIDLGVHCLDLARYLMGNPKPVSVVGSTYRHFGAYEVTDWTQYTSVDASGKSRFSDVEDLASAFIRFANGATLVLDVSWALNIKQETNYYELFGTKGGARLNPLELYTQLHGHLADITPVYKDTLAGGHEAADRHFVQSVLAGQETICPGEQGLEISLMLDAIYESARTGREVRLDATGG